MVKAPHAQFCDIRHKTVGRVQTISVLANDNGRTLWKLIGIRDILKERPDEHVGMALLVLKGSRKCNGLAGRTSRSHEIIDRF